MCPNSVHSLQIFVTVSLAFFHFLDSCPGAFSRFGERDVADDENNTCQFIRKHMRNNLCLLGNVPSRRLLKPWDVFLRSSKEETLSKIDETEQFLLKACWRSALPVVLCQDNDISSPSGSGNTASRAFRANAAASAAAAGGSSSAENDTKDLENKMKDPLKVVEDGITRMDVANLLQKKNKTRGPAIRVYKKLRQTAKAAELMLQQKILGEEDDADGTQDGDTKKQKSEKGGADAKKRKRDQMDNTPLPESPNLMLSTIDSLTDMLISSMAPMQSADEFLALQQRSNTKELLLLQCFMSVDGAHYLMDEKNVRQPVMQKLFPQEAVNGAAAQNGRLMFDCADDLEVELDGGDDNDADHLPLSHLLHSGKETITADRHGFYARQLEKVLRIFSAKQLELLEEEYNRLAAAEDFHAKLSYLVADCAGMLSDTIDCMHWLLDKFGCDRWPAPDLATGGMGPFEIQVKVVDPITKEEKEIQSQHEKLKLDSPWNYNLHKTILKDREISDVFRKWKRGIERRDPFTIGKLRLVGQKQGEKVPVERTGLVKKEYMTDVNTIRNIISFVLSKRKGKKENDIEDLVSLIRSVSAVYGDGYECERHSDIFDKFVGSRDTELFTAPERVWAEKKYREFVHESSRKHKKKTGAEKGQLYQQALGLLAELLICRGDLPQLKKSSEMCYEDLACDPEKESLPTVKQLLVHVKTIIDEIASSEQSYFDVYRRDAIRHRRIFSVAAVELWFQSEFLQTRDAQTIFLHQDLRDKVLQCACFCGPSFCTQDTMCLFLRSIFFSDF